MKFDKILEYQKNDLELQALEMEVAKSDAYKKVVLTKNALANATETGNKILTEATALLEQYGIIEKQLASLRSELDNFDGLIDDVQDTTEADYYIKAIAGIQDKIVALEKEANSCAQKLDQISANHKKTWEQGAKLSDSFSSAKREFAAYQQSKQPVVNTIKAKLSALQGEIPANFLNIYMALRSEKKLPAFVEYDTQKGRCGRCYMELSNDAKSKLRNAGDYAECPNCRRILFVPDQQ